MRAPSNSPTWVKQLTVLGLVGIFFAAIPGCATIFNGGDQNLNFDSEPAQAEVLVNGEKMGTTPVKLDLNPSKTHTVTFRRDGCEDVTKQLNTHVGAGWVILDIFGGVVGVAIDAATGNWKSFDDKQHYAEMDCGGTASAESLITESYTF